MQTINEIKEEIYPIFEPIIGTIRLKTYFPTTQFLRMD